MTTLLFYLNLFEISGNNSTNDWHLIGVLARMLSNLQRMRVANLAYFPC